MTAFLLAAIPVHIPTFLSYPKNKSGMSSFPQKSVSRIDWVKRYNYWLILTGIQTLRFSIWQRTPAMRLLAGSEEEGAAVSICGGRNAIQKTHF
jgi:hypothetical protein